ncbi:hypothetical protein KQI89_05455 [Clostridium sp. MSJ-4]|uniref:Uncharacterized protein n=1 Tax=Clostridium simiarum TaxID=2841506 RepID=A0ABS6EZY9_9CLOT|nr:hypothetical protein [Clostridium simiarum]MBU5591204.1 hypothetical protein [Clostridium simiarum]
MKDKKLPLGIRMAETISNTNHRNNIKESEDNDLMEFKQSLLKINKILDNNNFIQTLENNKEIRTSLKEIIIKSVNILA